MSNLTKQGFYSMRNLFRSNILPILATAVVMVGAFFAVGGRNRVAVEENGKENEEGEKKTNKMKEVKESKQLEPEAPKKSKREIQLDSAPVLVAYGSQSGNAMAIAQEVYEKLGRRGIDANLSELNDWKKWKHSLQNTKYALFVISTTGNGDAPDNCAKFYRYLRKKDIPKTFVEDLNFAVLGLGDTNYDKFCEMGKWLHSMLNKLGGTSMLPLACADDGTGLEDVVEPWMKNVVTTVRQRVKGHYKQADDASKQTSKAPNENPAEPVEFTKPASRIPTHAPTQSQELGVSSAPSLVSGPIDFSNTVLKNEYKHASDSKSKNDKPKSEVIQEEENGSEKPTTSKMAMAAKQSRSTVEIPNIVKNRGLLSFETCVGGEKIAQQLAQHARNADPSKFYKVVGLGLYDVSLKEATSLSLEEKDAGSSSPPASSASKKLSSGDGDMGVINIEDGDEEDNNHEEASYALKVEKVRYLTKGGLTAARRVVHAELSGGPPTYRVGDAIGIHCENQDDDVLATFGCLIGKRPSDGEKKEAEEESSENSLMALESVVSLTMARTGEPTSLPAGCAYNDANKTISKKCSSSTLMSTKRRRDSVYGVLKYGIDLSCSPKPQLCGALAQCCPLDSKDRGYLLALALKEDAKNISRRFSQITVDDLENEIDQNMGEVSHTKPKSASAFEKFVIGQQLKVSELLALFPSCKPPLSLLIGLLPPLSTRYYSISSSPLFIKQQQASSNDKNSSPNLTIAFSVDKWESDVKCITDGFSSSEADNQIKPIARYGLCTNWMEHKFVKYMSLNDKEQANKMKGATLMIEADMRPCTDFTLPKDPTHPVIMICGGTGVVPFIGFIQQRQALKQLEKLNSGGSGAGSGVGEGKVIEDKVGTGFAEANRSDRTSQNSPDSSSGGTPRLEDVSGSMALYFGCRNEDDWIYREEIESASNDGTLSSLRIAFSRKQKEKIYVQDLLRQDQDQILSLLLGDKACFYICGSARMSKDVNTALLQILTGKVDGSNDNSLDRSTLLSDAEADVLLTDLKDCGRYVQEVW